MSAGVAPPVHEQGGRHDERADAADDDEQLGAAAVERQPEDGQQGQCAHPCGRAAARIAQQRHRPEEQQRRKHAGRRGQLRPRRDDGHARQGDGQRRRERVATPVDAVSDRHDREAEQRRRGKRRDLTCEATVDVHELTGSANRHAD
jgi:hypothetical protein